ncbi:MAG: GNAT family N-acetyltransferase [Clostridiales bacterium]|nr:GNAT family N-acetyltransferase [Clostridiales bacterium]
MIKTTEISVCTIPESLKTELACLEKLNPCHQVYYTDQSAFFIRYKQTVDIFNFMPKLAFRLPLKIIGKPYSVSDKGYIGDNASVSELIKTTQGLSIVLNGDSGLELPCVYTLSSHEFYNRFTSFEHYLKSLRSHYRYRVKKALRRSSEIAMIRMDQTCFNEEHHKLYLEVYKNSKDKLECLSLEFFREFPSELYEFRLGETGELVGFIQLVHTSNKLIFLFGGFKQALNRTYDLYMSILIEIIRIGIDRGVEHIEFGQTAEETKQKLGCVPVKKYLYVHHSNKVLHYLISRILPLLSYKPHGITYHVFKDKL